jgi:hypothetical protein
MREKILPRFSKAHMREKKNGISYDKISSQMCRQYASLEVPQLPSSSYYDMAYRHILLPHHPNKKKIAFHKILSLTQNHQKEIPDSKCRERKSYVIYKNVSMSAHPDIVTRIDNFLPCS